MTKATHFDCCAPVSEKLSLYTELDLLHNNNNNNEQNELKQYN